MRRTIGAFLVVLASSLFKRWQSRPMDYVTLAKLKMSLVYVRSIKTFRLLFLSLLSIGVCLVFLMAAIVLIHVTLFLYAPWSMGTKMLVGLICAGFYLLATLGIFYQMFSSSQWLKIFHAGRLIERLHQESVSKHAATEPEPSRNR